MKLIPFGNFATAITNFNHLHSSKSCSFGFLWNPGIIQQLLRANHALLWMNQPVAPLQCVASLQIFRNNERVTARDDLQVWSMLSTLQWFSSGWNWNREYDGGGGPWFNKTMHCLCFVRTNCGTKIKLPHHFVVKTICLDFNWIFLNGSKQCGWKFCQDTAPWAPEIHQQTSTHPHWRETWTNQPASNSAKFCLSQRVEIKVNFTTKQKANISYHNNNIAGSQATENGVEEKGYESKQ